MAAPMVAGVAALAVSANPQISAADLRAPAHAERHPARLRSPPATWTRCTPCWPPARAAG